MGLYVLAKEHHTANELKGRKFSAQPEINKKNFKFVFIYDSEPKKIKIKTLNQRIHFILNHLSVEIYETFFAIDIMEFSKTRNARINAHRMCT